MIEILLIFAFLAFISKKQPGILVCGLVGFSGKTSFNLDKIKFLMLWNSIERGKDATGIYSPTSGILKEAEPAGKFFTNKIMGGLKEDNTLICHVRAKTIGLNSAKNAHPFEYGDIVLAHNGTLVDYYAHNGGLAHQYGITFQEYDVDSQILAIAVNANTQKDGKIEVLSQYKGAAALLFYNKKTDVLYAYHDKERPLFRGWDEEGNLYISSIGLALESVGVYGVEEFPINTLYGIKNGEIVSEDKYQTYNELHPKPAIINVKSKKALKREKKKLPKLIKGQRGFISSDCKPSWLVGYNLRAKVTVHVSASAEAEYTGVFAQITANKFYYVEGYYDDGKCWLLITDDRGVEAQVNMHVLDFGEFIPRAGDFVRIENNIISTKTKERLWSTGDIVKVHKDSFEEGELELYHIEKNYIYTLPAENVSYLSQDEITKSLEKDKEINLLEIANTPPSCEIDDMPFKDSETTEIINEEQGTSDEDQDAPDEFIAIEIFEGVVNNISKHINTLEEKYTANEDIIPNINEIKAILSYTSDPAYLENLVS